VITPYPYQEAAARWLCQNKLGMVIAPAGSGKTVVAARALDIAVTAKPRTVSVKIGWMCNTQEQKNQALSAIDAFPAVAAQDCVVECAQADTIWSDRDVLIVDECQHSTAPQWSKAIQTCKGAKWFFSATPWIGDPDRDNEMRLMCGDNIYEIDRGAVAEKMADGEFMFHFIDIPGMQQRIDGAINEQVSKRMWQTKTMPFQQLWGQIAFRACMDIGIVGNAKRNRMVCEIAMQNKDRNTLILVGQVDHGAALELAIPGSRLLHSGIGKKARKEAISAARDGELKCTIATSLADEGMDIPILDTLIMACSGKNTNRTIQRTGRVMRKHDGKTTGVIHDFMDFWHPLAAKHSRTRREIYLGLNYKEIPLTSNKQ